MKMAMPKPKGWSARVRSDKYLHKSPKLLPQGFVHLYSQSGNCRRADKFHTMQFCTWVFRKKGATKRSVRGCHEAASTSGRDRYAVDDLEQHVVEMFSVENVTRRIPDRFALLLRLTHPLLNTNVAGVGVDKRGSNMVTESAAMKAKKGIKLAGRASSNDNSIWGQK